MNVLTFELVENLIFSPLPLVSVSVWTADAESAEDGSAEALSVAAVV